MKYKPDYHNMVCTQCGLKEDYKTLSAHLLNCTKRIVTSDNRHNINSSKKEVKL